MKKIEISKLDELSSAVYIGESYIRRTHADFECSVTLKGGSISFFEDLPPARFDFLLAGNELIPKWNWIIGLYFIKKVVKYIIPNATMECK